jgi:UDP-3-O-[3-hydroxymyristoyl] glucosamine N-acyltransferase
MSIKVKDILAKIDYIKFIGDEQSLIEKPVGLNGENSNPNVLMWVNAKNISLLEQIKAGTIIVPKEALKVKMNADCQIIWVENPRRAFMQVLNDFFVKEKVHAIAANATIHSSVKLGKNVGIGSNVVIEENCEIGDNTTIDHNTVIKENTIIGKNVIIGSNNTIGGAGYGYEKNEEGQFEFIPHLGNVVIKDLVEIGNNTCIDRAVLGSTILDQNVKVDNLVHIAHGVHAGLNSMIIANSMIAGSVKIGANAWIAPSASILNQKSIGDNALIGMGAVVLKNVPEGKIFIGNPARDLKERGN